MSLCWYHDESGQIGGDVSKPNVSASFYCAMIGTDDPKKLERCVKKTIRGFSQNQLEKFTGTLHAYNELDRTRFRLLTYIAQTDVKIVLLRVDKAKLHRRFPKKSDVELYQYVVSELFGKAAKNDLLSRGDGIVLSRFFVKKSHNNDLVDSVIAKTYSSDCSVVPAHQNKCLQAVDFIAWAHYMKHERDDSAYLDVISDKILAEYSI
jgi:hypothetical protein